MAGGRLDQLQLYAFCTDCCDAMSLGAFALKSSIQLLIAVEITFMFWAFVNRMTTSGVPAMTRDVRRVHNESVSTAAYATAAAAVYRKDVPAPAEHQDEVAISPSPASDTNLAARHDVSGLNVSRKPEKEVHNIFYLKVVASLYLRKFCLRALQHTSCILRFFCIVTAIYI